MHSLNLGPSQHLGAWDDEKVLTECFCSDRCRERMCEEEPDALEDMETLKETWQ